MNYYKFHYTCCYCGKAFSSPVKFTILLNNKKYKLCSKECKGKAAFKKRMKKMTLKIDELRVYREMEEFIKIQLDGQLYGNEKLQEFLDKLKEIRNNASIFSYR